MNTTVLLVVLVVFSFAISRLLSRYASRFFLVSGIEYLLLGIILGPFVTAILSAEAIGKFIPLIDLLLGLVGFLLGLRARSALRPGKLALGGSSAALVVIALVTAASFAFLEYFVAAPDDSHPLIFASFEVAETLVTVGGTIEHLWLALTLGCAAAVSSPMLIAQAASFHRARGPTLDLLMSYAHTGQLVAVAVFGATLVWARAADSADFFQVPITLWLLGTLGVGILIGLLFNLFIGRERDPMRIYVAALGTVTFASGAGAALGVSPLIINLLAGFVVSFTSSHASRLAVTLTPLRHPILVLLRLFAGALWAPVIAVAWILPAIYVAVRIAGRWLTTWPASMLRRDLPPVPRLGLGLVGQGGLAVAIALSFYERFPGQADIILTTTLCGLLLSDVWSYRALRRILADAGETDAAIDPGDPSASRTRTRGHRIVAPPGGFAGPGEEVGD